MNVNSSLTAAHLAKPQWLLDSENRLPFWLCKNRLFHSKVAALEYATKNNTDIQLYFNDVEFGQVKWTVEPPEPIDYYYLQRVKQLRDQYDYIVLLYSGGADSSTIFKTFLRNNIHLDEVMTYGGWSHRVDKWHDMLNLEPQYAAGEMLELGQKHNIKITFANMIDHMHTVYPSTDWIYDADPRLNPDNHFKYQTVHARRDLFEMVESGKKVALVFGHDKPRILIKDGSIYLAYLDVGALSTNIWPQMFDAGYVGPSMELFYPNIHVPEIMVKQGHMIADWYLKTFGMESENLLSPNALFDKNYHSRVNCIMYPTTWREFDTYTIGKPWGGMTWEFKSKFLFERMQDTKQNSVFWQGIDQVKKIIAPRFWGKQGLIGHWTKFYKLRDMPKFDRNL